MNIKYVEFFFFGIIVSETSMKLRQTDDPNAIDIPTRAYGFRFCERTEHTIDGEKLEGNFSYDDVFFYAPGAKVFTLDELKTGAVKGDNSILIDNMKINNWKRVVLTNCGSASPFKQTDKILR